MRRDPRLIAAACALFIGCAGLLFSAASRPPQFPPPAMVAPAAEAAAAPSFWPGLLLLAALAAAAALLKKRQAARPACGVKVLGSVAVAQNQRLVAVKFAGRVLLLGQTSTGLNTLADTADAAEIERLEGAAAESAARPEPEPPLQAFLKKFFSGRAAATLGALAALALLPAAAHAQAVPHALSLTLDAARGPQQTVASLQILLLMTVLAFVPALLLMATSFTRIVIVLSLLKQAMGIPQIPPSQIVVALSLFLTFFVMRPQINAINETAFQPYMAGRLSTAQALKTAEGPLRGFMVAQTRRKDLQFFTTMSGVKDAAEVPLTVLVPAFVTSELKTAFQIGFLLFIPFLLVDMIVASILMSMGMVMIPPAMISMPFKLLLFVLIDGWNLVLSGLVSSFR